MSLTSFLNLSDVKKRFREEFPKPQFDIDCAVLAPPQTQRFAQIGTAYDYLLRFCLKRKYRFAIDHRWIAERALGSPLMLLPLSSQVVYTLDEYDNVTQIVKKETITIAREIIQKAKFNYCKYMHDGKLSRPLIKSALQLAQLDPVYRASHVDDNLGNIAKADVDDLNRIITNTDLSLFKAKRVCLLNPTFGIASKLVGNADADLIIDDKLIEIKTTKNLSLARREFNQLLGYYFLYRIGHIDGAPKKHKIKHLGIYYSRHNYLHLLDVNDFINERDISAFIKWFTARAEQAFPARYRY